MSKQTTTTKEVSMEVTIKELHVAYRKLNEVFFKNELPTPAIVIQSQGNRSAYGWVSVEKIWTSQDGEIQQYELGIASEHLNNRENGYLDVIQTLLHEMCHIANLEEGIQDCSRGNTYHNRKFKTRAENSGMVYPFDKPCPKLGFSQVVLTDSTKAIVQNIGIDESAFLIGRMDFSGAKAKKKSNSYKWVCGCGQIVRTTKPELFAHCPECDEDFQME